MFGAGREAVGYRVISGVGELPGQLDELGARALVVDVEPLVAFWDTGQAELRDGVTRVLEQVAGTGVRTVVFATNSSRTLSALPVVPALRVGYLASAGKPLRRAPYRDLPRPAAVVGDQVATDGVLARRLGFTFLHYRPDVPDIPVGPRVMRFLGRPIHALLFS
jgi:predicted HAD superfamily phosphohydrolase YqeG